KRNLAVDLSPLSAGKLEANLEMLRQPTSTDSQTRTRFEGELQGIENTLEEVAWRETYRSAWQDNASREMAVRNFVAEFVRVRMFNIERHEAAHLLDLQNNPFKIAKRDDSYEKFTELNAFYTELAYSPNPLDVMAQAASGLLEEMRQKKQVDYSLEK